MTSALDVPCDSVERGFRDGEMATNTYIVITTLGPKLTVSAASSPIPIADPKPLFWVTGIVLGLLAAWVLYVVFTGESRKPSASSDPKPSSDGAE